MTHQISAADNRRLDAAQLTVLRASLYEQLLFRRQQLRDMARSVHDVSGTAGSRDTAAHSEIRDKLAVAALADTEAALARMDAGRYGGCGRCGRTISLQCLSVHPQARHCTRCQHFLATEE